MNSILETASAILDEAETKATAMAAKAEADIEKAKRNLRQAESLLAKIHKARTGVEAALCRTKQEAADD